MTSWYEKTLVESSQTEADESTHRKPSKSIRSATRIVQQATTLLRALSTSRGVEVGSKDHNELWDHLGRLEREIDMINRELAREVGKP